ncbi:TPA: DUF2285 domain-containing protein, partial [Enterobacter asburiae]|nr:DUF2285 domain-containing protein [Enterobacter asburiae]
FYTPIKVFENFLWSDNKCNLESDKLMKYLNVLDKSNDGISHRAIAYMLYPKEASIASWHSDSWLRARVRYSIQKAKLMVNGGYCKLL